jgi:GntR family transcriptional regulator
MEPIQPFLRLQKKLSEIIASTPPGEKLPSEPKLAKLLGVSRATLREAMRTFESQGFILRRQGIGTFVVNRHQIIETGLEVLESIETLAGKIGLAVTMGDLTIEPLEASSDQALIFNVELGTPMIQVRRTILADIRPVAYLIDILPQKVLKPEDLKLGFTGSVLDLLLRRGSPMLSKSIANIQADQASIEVSRALHIQRGDVLLVFDARLIDTAGEVVDYSISYFLPGYFKFHVVRSVQ